MAIVVVGVEDFSLYVLLEYKRCHEQKWLCLYTERAVVIGEIRDPA